MTPAVRKQIAAAMAEQRVSQNPVNKYGAIETPCRNGHIHDSAREAGDCDRLHLLQRGGLITDLQVQHQFWFVINGQELRHASNGHRVGVKFDFTYRDVSTDRLIAQDSKGYRVRDWPLRRAVFEALHPEYEVRET